MNHLMPKLLLLALSVTLHPAAAAEPAATPAAPYLLPGSPTFDLTITQFREKFNATNPGLKLNEFRAIIAGSDKVNLTRAATKINENLYASTALERGTLKIKSMQITSLATNKAAKSKAQEYMAGLLKTFTPGLSDSQSREWLSALLAKGKDKRYYEETEGAIRYVVADNGEKGLTFAIEPIKLTLSESPDSNK